jgi:transcriptional regulator with PAS, ATPase and Fis domain
MLQVVRNVGNVGKIALAARHGFEGILGESDAIRRAIELARVAARNELSVIFCGESGTGKELFAHAVHSASARSSGPFVVVNCGSIPSELVASELFGYEAGAFTGGRTGGRAGRFEDADGGTLFLDEVSELSPMAQTALLRVLQEKEIVRVGGSVPRPVDVRVVAATNKPLDEEIRAKRFRRDLYYRLNVLSIAVPPLRERGDDVALLAEAFLSDAERQVGRRGLSLSAGALAALRTHPWPGNVRELNNVLLRAAATAPCARLEEGDLVLEAADLEPRLPRVGSCRPLRDSVREVVREEILRTLEACHWNFAQAAQQLGICRMTLYRRMGKSGISRSSAPAR